MKHTLLHALRSVDRALLGRGDRRSVLVDGWTSMNYTMVAPIHRAMAGDPRVQFYFTASASPRDGRRIFREAGNQARIIVPARAALMRFDAYLTSELTWVALPRGGPRVQMFHGVAGKLPHLYDAPSTSMRHWHRLFFVNARRMRNFVSSGAVDEGSPALRLVGMPKVDCLVNGSLRRHDVLTGLQLDPSLPTVLYAPTWTAHSSLNALGEQLVTRLAALPINVIVKLHDHSLNPLPECSGGVDWLNRLRPLMDRARGVVATESDVCPYLAAADVMITDHSSAGFEYLLCDRPLIRVHLPELIRHSRISPEYVGLMAEAAATVHTADEAIRAVETALRAPRDRSASRRAVAAELFFGPGSATYRAVDEMYSLMELPAPATLARLNEGQRDSRHSSEAEAVSS